MKAADEVATTPKFRSPTHTELVLVVSDLITTARHAGELELQLDLLAVLEHLVDRERWS